MPPECAALSLSRRCVDELLTYRRELEILKVLLRIATEKMR